MNIIIFIVGVVGVLLVMYFLRVFGVIIGIIGLSWFLLSLYNVGEERKQTGTELRKVVIDCRTNKFEYTTFKDGKIIVTTEIVFKNVDINTLNRFDTVVLIHPIYSNNEKEIFLHKDIEFANDRFFKNGHQHNKYTAWRKMPIN